MLAIVLCASLLALSEPPLPIDPDDAAAERDAGSIDGDGPAAQTSVDGGVASEPLSATARISMLSRDVAFGDSAADTRAHGLISLERKFGAVRASLVVAASFRGNLTPNDEGTYLGAEYTDPARAWSVAAEFHPFSPAHLRVGRAEPVRLSLALPTPGGDPQPLGGALRARSGAFDAVLAVFSVRTSDEEERRFAAAATVGWTGARYYARATALRLNYGTLVGGPRPTTVNDSWALGGHLEGGFAAGGPIPRPVDFTWERQNPDLYVALFADSEPTTGTATEFFAEASWLAEQVADPARSGAATMVPASTAAAVAAVRAEAVRLHARAFFRSMAAVLSPPVAGFAQYAAAPGTKTGEYGCRLQVEYAFGDRRPRPGLLLGVLMPAGYAGTFPSTRVPAEFRTVVIRGPNQANWLQPGLNVSPVVEANATVTWSPFAAFGVAAQLGLRHDPNRMRFSTSWSTFDGVYEPPDRIVASVLVQFRL